MIDAFVVGVEFGMRCSMLIMAAAISMRVFKDIFARVMDI